MTGISAYQATIPVFIKGLRTLSLVLDKASSHAEASSLDANKDYAPARLINDMLPLTFQIQAATNTAKKTITRLTGKELEVWDDKETTMADMQARLAKAIALLEAQKPEEFEGTEDKTVELPLGEVTATLTGQEYVLMYALPNFFFHVQTAYGILRAKGVPIGKRDYLKHFLEGKLKQV